MPMRKLILFILPLLLCLGAFAQEAKPSSSEARLFGLPYRISPSQVEKLLRAKSPNLRAEKVNEDTWCYLHNPKLINLSLEQIYVLYTNNQSYQYSAFFGKMEANALTTYYSLLVQTLTAKYGNPFATKENYDLSYIKEEELYKRISEIIQGRGEINTMWRVGDIAINLNIPRGNNQIILGYIDLIQYTQANQQKAEDL